MSKNNSRESNPLPAYADVAALDWPELSTALRMLAGPGAQWKNSDLGNMRKVAICAIEQGDLDSQKTLGPRYKPSRLIKPSQFFRWAYGKWPDKCRALGVPVAGNLAGILPGLWLCFAATAHSEPQDDESLLRQHRELQEEAAALKRLVEALKPDTEKYRAQVERGRKYGGSPHDE